MKQEDLIKWALIAVGAYLVYQWLSRSALLGGATQQLPAGGQTGAGAGAGSQTGTGTQAGAGSSGSSGGATNQTNGGNTGGGTVVPEDRDLQLMKAAWSANDAALTGSTKMNVHQWNWYRAKMAANLGIEFDQNAHSPAVDAVADPNLLYTAAEYHAILQQMGLTGIGWGSPTFGGYRRSWMN